MEVLLGVVTAVVGLLSLWLRSKAGNEKALTKQNEALRNRNKSKDKYISELEKGLLDNLSGDELADKLNKLFETKSPDDSLSD